MAKIKTITHETDYAFDRDVNEALEEGYSIKEITVLSVPERAPIRYVAILIKDE